MKNNVEQVSKIKEMEEQIAKFKRDLNYDTRDYPIEFIVSLYRSDTARMYVPEYQRNELLWSVSYKSRFIESLILDYPIPLIFLADTTKGELEIIDGLQRISTLAEFIDGDLKLENMNKLTKLNGCSFETLPSSEKNRLKARSLRIIVLKESTPAEVRTDLFDRLNTSSLRANPSEIRSGRESENGLMKLIKRLKENSLFKDTTKLSDSLLNRKEDIELISRFFAYSNDIENYKGHVTNFIDQYVKKEGEVWSEEKEKIFENEFLTTMKFVKTNFIRGFQKEDKNQTPRVRFEAIAVGINLAFREQEKLNVSSEQIENLLSSEEFRMWTTTDAANNRNKLVTRIYGVRDFFLDK